MRGSLLPLEEAQDRLFALLPPLSAETLPLGEALGRYTSTPVSALRTQPEAPLSAMDGYAVHADDLPGPWNVVGESAAGRPFDGRVATGEAVRISTGAIVPDGTDCIVVQEDCEVDGNRLRLTGGGPQPPGCHIRKAGMDFSRSDTVLEKGVKLTSARLALAAMAGYGELAVGRAPRIALFDSGDELMEPGKPLRSGQIPATNALMLAAMLAAEPCEIVQVGHLPDVQQAVVDTLAALPPCDAIATTGGASVGDHDVMKPALEQLGATIDFWRVAMRPGKPLMAGRLGDTALLGLPGNPASAFVTAHVFLLPLLRHLAGSHTPRPRTYRAALADDLPANGPRRQFVRARIENGNVFPLPSKDSSLLSVMANADALIVRPEGDPAQPQGSRVEALLLDHD